MTLETTYNSFFFSLLLLSLAKEIIPRHSQYTVKSEIKIVIVD